MQEILKMCVFLKSTCKVSLQMEIVGRSVLIQGLFETIRWASLKFFCTRRVTHQVRLEVIFVKICAAALYALNTDAFF